MLFCIPFIVSAVMIAVSSCQEVMFAQMLEGYNNQNKVQDEKPTEVIPKGYYKCIDCGLVCKRLNASQKRCSDCQKFHSKELKRISDKNRKR